MAGGVYALLVGINDYGGRFDPLAGCLNDVDGFRELLLDLVPRPMLWTRELRDAEATRQAVIDGFTGHLARAGAGDAAVFCFSGYGSMEPGGEHRTIVCADSRTPGVPDLVVGEINALIGQVTAGGAHVLVVLDCGHAGCGTGQPGVRVRGVLPNPEPRRIAYAAEQGGGPPRVVLSACGPTQPALELPIDGRQQGAFSAMLRQSLAVRGPTFAYWAQLGWACHSVTQLVHGQEPVGYAVPPAAMDEPTFGGVVRPRPPGARLERYRDRWWIDVGSVHGIPPPLDGWTTVVAVRPPQPDGAPPLGRARVSEVESRHCRVTVDPGWDPDPSLRYPATVVDLPLPPARFRLDGDPAATALVRAHLADSPHVHETHVHEAHDDEAHVRETHDHEAHDHETHDHETHVHETRDRELSGEDGDFVVSARHGWLTIAGADGTPLAAPVPATPEGAAVLRDRLDHLGRWQVIKRLDNPVSTIARGQVRLHLTKPRHGALPKSFSSWPKPGRDHPVHLGYHPTGNGWSANPGRLSLGNSTGRPLYCALLTLADDFRIHDQLLPTRLIPPRSSVDITEAAGGILKHHGEGRTPVDEWWKIIASEQPFDSAAFGLPHLGEPVIARSAAVRNSRSVLNRLAVQAVTRDPVVEPDGGPEWATALLTVHHRLAGGPGREE
ncbi:caspase family protein [Actinoplanes sp. ATCC 53533]|uniref:caspase family protein n=1 Tax=Actinoplanes sp. ATCC 53533 TaxID=1288362 RepID=UPI0013158014|nr:caspase family protein [Actinoplanes sp. ATCC 53533]